MLFIRVKSYMLLTKAVMLRSELTFFVYPWHFLGPFINKVFIVLVWLCNENICVFRCGDLEGEASNNDHNATIRFIRNMHIVGMPINPFIYARSCAQSRQCDVKLIEQTSPDSFRKVVLNNLPRKYSKTTCFNLFFRISRMFIHLLNIWHSWILLHLNSRHHDTGSNLHFTRNWGYEADDRNFSISKVAVVLMFSSSRRCR